jgi:hypothetical protein
MSIQKLISIEQIYFLLNFMQCMNLNEVSISKVFHIQISTMGPLKFI